MRMRKKQKAYSSPPLPTHNTPLSLQYYLYLFTSSQ